MDPMVHLVEFVLADRKVNGKKEFLIKYKGLSYHETKWITEDDFNNDLSF